MWLRGTLAVSQTASCAVASSTPRGLPTWPPHVAWASAQHGGWFYAGARPRRDCLCDLPAQARQRPGCCVLFSRNQSRRGGTLDPPSPDACHSSQSCFKTSVLRLASCTYLWRVLAHSWWTDGPWCGPLTHPMCRCQVAVPGVCSLTPPQFWRLPFLHSLSLQHLLLGTLIFAHWWVWNSILLF